ncbi:MAG: alpha/beta hydrolase [Alphaproteobacteria bacterium]|jgi:pimeloyl-ACP methyl ester carboxylesterase|nr:alpha/beta hydrolase [Alphaproteobacteria bacterium]
MPFLERRITSFDNLSLYLRDYGNPLDPRVPLFCLGGLTRNSKDFESLAERYSSDGRRVICPDYRGRGQSQYDANWSNYDPRTYIRDIQDILAALNVHRVVVVGTSLGGILGMGMAAAMPTALAAVVMNDVGPVVETEGLDFIIDYIKEDRPHDDWDAAVVTIKRMLPNLTFQDEGIWLRMAENTFRRCDDGKLRFDWDVNIAKPLLASDYEIPDMWPLFRALADIPALVLRGAESDILSPACFAEMQTVKPDLVAVEIPRAGHVPTLAEPESRAALDDFLGRH